MNTPVAITKAKGRRASIGGISISFHKMGTAWRAVRRERGKIIQSKRCPTLESAKLLFRQWEADLHNAGAAALDISHQDRTAILDFHRATADMAPQPTVRSALDWYLREHAAALTGWTVDEAVDARLHEIDLANLSKRYRAGTAGRLRIFAKDFGKRAVRTLKRPEIESWLHRKAAAPLTFASYQRLLYGLFQCAVRAEKLEVNPVAGIKPPKNIPAPPGILTPPQCRALLAACPDEIRPAVAIALFAGVRRAELEKLDWKDVKISKGLIDLSAIISKTRSRRLVEMPKNLIAWLLPVARPAGAIIPSPQIFRNRLEDSRAAAGITDWPPNAMRHSCASYKAAIEPNLHTVAKWLGNSAEIILRHYKEVVDAEAAEAWFSITPGDARKIIKFGGA